MTRARDLANAQSTKASLSGATFTGNLFAPTFRATNSAGGEGGEITFAPPATGSSITGGVTFDIQTNNVRIFESGGTNRGVNLDITALPAGTGSRIALAGVNGNPFRMAANSTFFNTGVTSVTVTLPAGRFTQAPMITTSATPTGNVAMFSLVFNVTTTSFTQYLYGGSYTAGTISAYWIAVQMTSGAAGG